MAKQLFNILTLATVSVAAIALVSCSPKSSETKTADHKPAVTQTVTANAVSTGSFSGRSDHVTSGEVSIVKTATGYDLVLADNFFLDGAPDPVLGFGSNDKFDQSTIFSKLEKKKGGQTYSLPAGFTLGNHSQVFVWCGEFSVPLGVATLSK